MLFSSHVVSIIPADAALTRVTSPCFLSGLPAVRSLSVREGASSSAMLPPRDFWQVSD